MTKKKGNKNLSNVSSTSKNSVTESKKTEFSNKNEKKEIEEPESAQINSTTAELSIGDKKLMRQREKEAKELKQREPDEAKKTSEQKKSNTTKSKQKTKPTLKSKDVSKSVECHNEISLKESKIVDKSHRGNKQKEFNTDSSAIARDNQKHVEKSVKKDAWNDDIDNDFLEQQPRKEIRHVPYQQNYENSQRTFNFQFDNYKDSERHDNEFQKFLSDLRRKQIASKKVKEVKGDLFSAPAEYSLAHCVAEDFSMGAGIAKTFRSKYKQVPDLLNQRQKTGGLALLTDKDIYIYYLVTKKISKGKPTLYTLWLSLNKLKQHMKCNNVTKLAIPQIGCGLDRLNWREVKLMLEFIFQDLDVDIVVYILEENNEQIPATSLRKCFVQQVVKPLTNIESGTGLVYFGTEDGAKTNSMGCLMKKFNFIADYKNGQRNIGNIIKTVDKNEYIYGIIVKKSMDDSIDFKNFEKCLFNFRNMLKKDKTNYIGFEGFIDKNDDVIVPKIISLMQYVLVDVEIWICWPKELECFCLE